MSRQLKIPQGCLAVYPGLAPVSAERPTPVEISISRPDDGGYLIKTYAVTSVSGRRLRTWRYDTKEGALEAIRQMVDELGPGP